MNKKISVKLFSASNYLLYFFISILLIVSLIFIDKFNHFYDLTNTRKFTISEESSKILEELKENIDILVFSTKESVEGNTRKDLHKFFKPYLSHTNKIILKFVDPREEPFLAEKYKITQNGEVVINFNNQSANIKELTESNFLNTVNELTNVKISKLYFIEGHGESGFDSLGPRGSNRFFNSLSKAGFKFEKFNLFNEEISKLPASATLILLSPDKNLLKGEMRQIISHIDSGINFVWFLNSKKLDYENELSEYLGIKISNNTIESKRSVNLNMSKDFTIPKQINKFGSLNDFNGTIVLPFTRIIKQNTSSKFNFKKIVDLDYDDIKNKRGFMSEQFDLSNDNYSPIIIGKNNAKVIVSTSSDFFSNENYGLYSNLEFGIKLFRFLNYEINKIFIAEKTRDDLSLLINNKVFYSSNFFLILPVIFFILGFFVWWKRKRY